MYHTVFVSRCQLQFMLCVCIFEEGDSCKADMLSADTTKLSVSKSLSLTV